MGVGKEGSINSIKIVIEIFLIYFAFKTATSEITFLLAITNLASVPS